MSLLSPRARRAPLALACSAPLLLCSSAITPAAWARPARVQQVPNGDVLSCLTCHFSPYGGAVNSFGYDVQLTLVGGAAQWTEVCALDSDLDGFSNAVELNDPMCLWRAGPSPGGSVTAPGDPASFPGAPPVPDAALPDEGVMDAELPDALPPPTPPSALTCSRGTPGRGSRPPTPSR